MKQLFFDDNLLFEKENLSRKYGKPKLVSIYNDGITSTDYCTGNVFRLDNGKYRMLYFAHSEYYLGKKLLSAISDDGITFYPEKLNISTDKTLINEINLNMPDGFEVAAIYEDKITNEPKERYKLLMSEFDWQQPEVIDRIYVSKDLLHWSAKESVLWGDGTEPMASVFYNNHKKCHTIIERPFWGIRCVGYKETNDWNTFSNYRYCLNVDAGDEDLSEIYGMHAFVYDGIYIGIPHIYKGLKSELNAKYKNGIIEPQLAYSYDGRYWQRSLRKPFVNGLCTNKYGERYPLVWVSSLLKTSDGKVRFYASASEREHGSAFSRPQNGEITGKILIYEMRPDGLCGAKGI